MQSIDLVLFGCLALALALLLAVGRLLRERCPRCGSKRTGLVREEPAEWFCANCRRYFGPAAVDRLPRDR